MGHKIALLSIFMLAGCVSQTPSGLLGISGRGLDTASLLEIPAINETDHVIRHTGYVISYNTETHIPDWVAYELTAEETHGKEERNDRMFQMDPDFSTRNQAMREDYKDSGWTKGHMAPAADFRWDVTAMDETFYLTNVCPQKEELNRKDWEYLERQVRHWAQDYGRIWVVTGPIIGTNRYGTIGDHDVVVPDAFYKALLINRKDRFFSIAFVMENNSSRQYLQDCAISVNELEEITGIDFFANLDDGIEDKVEGQLRLQDWGLNRY